MLILHIMASRDYGGAETYSTDIMLSLHEKGINQCVVMAQDSPRYTEICKAGIRTAPEVLGCSFFRKMDPFPGCGKSYFPLSGFFTKHFRLFQRLALRRVLEREKPDIIHCWMRRAASLMPSSGYRDRAIGWFGGYYDTRKFKACGHFIGVTQDIVEHQIRNGVPRERAHYIPTFPNVKEELPVDRATLNTPQDAFVILALSRLHQKKGLDTLLYAAKKLPGAYVWLAGEGPLRSDLEKLTRELGIQDRVRFLGWRTDRGALLKAANVCALPSRYEPFGTVILEAWAAGTPFVACKSAGPMATVTDGRNGLLVEIDDFNGLTKAFARVRDDAVLRQFMIEEGQKAYLANYTREAVTDRMIRLYEQIISDRGIQN